MTSPSLLAKDRIVLPLDFASLDEATAFIKLLKDHVGLFKVGLTLFVKEGPIVIRRIHEIAGNKVFFDLKFHDTPGTVAGVSRALMSISSGVRFVTVHASEGEPAIRAAVDAMRDGAEVLGVTVLTSLGEADLKALGYQPTVERRVLELAKIAKDAGCAGVVCSGYEAKMVKQAMGQDFIVVTPGIRPKWATVPGDDQRRIMTPGEAIINGADYLVVGRPIYNARDPVQAAEKIAQEIEEAVQELRKINQ